MKILRAALMFLCISSPVLAQQAESPTDAVKIDDHHITLDVVVSDHSGAAVRGLQQSDFTVLDNKQPQNILSFHAVDATATQEPVAEIVLLVDTVNASFQVVAQEKEQISSFLRQNGGHLPQPVSMIFLSDTGTQVENTATRDGNALADFLDKKENALRNLRRSTGFYGAVERFQLSLQTLGQIAGYESKKPGRKMLIWISPGWATLSGPHVELTTNQQQQLFHTIAATSNSLRQARITLYSIDPLGTLDAGGFRTFYYKEFLKPVTVPRNAQAGNLALQVIAEQSGGRVFNSSNDVTAEINHCVADMNAFYVLSFVPPQGEPNEYHAIDVKIGKPGLTARTRAGYYSEP
jgi:VWFA-related protein